MELIDRAKVERITFQEPSYSDPINVLTEVGDKVRALPTVDAVPVIRCKDCKWWNGYYSCIRTASDDFDEDDYCSLAEREEE